MKTGGKLIEDAWYYCLLVARDDERTLAFGAHENLPASAFQN